MGSNPENSSQHRTKWLGGEKYVGFSFAAISRALFPPHKSTPRCQLKPDPVALILNAEFHSPIRCNGICFSCCHLMLTSWWADNAELAKHTHMKSTNKSWLEQGGMTVLESFNLAAKRAMETPITCRKSEESRAKNTIVQELQLKNRREKVQGQPGKTLNQEKLTAVSVPNHHPRSYDMLARPTF